MAHSIDRTLTTILAADVEGYSRLMEADEAGALVALRESRAVFARLIERHRGRIANTAGDGLIADSRAWSRRSGARPKCRPNSRRATGARLGTAP